MIKGRPYLDGIRYVIVKERGTRFSALQQEYYLMWPYVKNLVPHQSEYNYGRMQEVWLDK
jgi:hypothetical protein